MCRRQFCGEAAKTAVPTRKIPQVIDLFDLSAQRNAAGPDLPWPARCPGFEATPERGAEQPGSGASGRNVSGRGREGFKHTLCPCASQSKAQGTMVSTDRRGCSLERLRRSLCSAHRHRVFKTVTVNTVTQHEQVERNVLRDIRCGRGVSGIKGIRPGSSRDSELTCVPAGLSPGARNRHGGLEMCAPITDS